MLISITNFLTNIIFWLPALSVFVLFLSGTVHIALTEVHLKKSTSIIFVSIVYILCFVGLLYLILYSEELANVIDKISFRLLATLVMYASSPISMLVSMAILFIVHGKKVGFDNI